MGKRIIQQRRGRGTSTYRVKKKAYRYDIKIPSKVEGEGNVENLFNSPAHTCPMAKVSYKKENGEKNYFYVPAFRGMVEGQKIKLDSKETDYGNIVKLKDLPLQTPVYNVESRPYDGGRFITTSGTYGNVTKKVGGKVYVTMPSKKQKGFNPECRALVGVIAGEGRKAKPIVQAGKNYYRNKARGKLYPRSSAVKMNALDHPFGSGRGKNPKSKIAKRNAPPGKKVGLIRPRRTGKK